MRKNKGTRIYYTVKAKTYREIFVNSDYPPEAVYAFESVVKKLAASIRYGKPVEENVLSIVPVKTRRSPKYSF